MASNGSNHKQVAVIDRKLRAVELFMQGWPATEIAKEIKVHLSVVYDYIADARAEILRTKRDHFDTRLSGLLDEQINALTNQSAMLGDAEFVRSLSADQLQALSVSYGVLADKTFILLSAAQRFNQRENPEAAIRRIADGSASEAESGD